MEDKRKIKSQLKRELVELRQQVGELEASKIECDQAKTESDSTIAEWMGTTRRNIQKYKNQLKEVGLLDIMCTWGRVYLGTSMHLFSNSI